MMKDNFYSLLFISGLCLLATSLSSQSNINQTLSVNGTGATADLSAQLDVSATDKGMLVPRMTSAQRTAIASPATGLLVFDTDTGSFWYKATGGWTNLLPGGSAAWSLTGSSVASGNFLGTTNAQPLLFKVNNTRAGHLDYDGNFNTSFGFESFLANTSGFYNTATGVRALKANTSGGRNTANGFYALYVNETGGNNTAIGTYALSANTGGNGNTAVGVDALGANVSANNNTAFGLNALRYNNSGSNNAAVGALALEQNIGGQQNTATGFAALYLNTNGSYNTATGAGALNSNTASSNTAHGAYALYLNSTGNNNTATGRDALYSNTEGYYNTATGYRALYSNTDGVNNTATGYRALYSNTEGYNNTATGRDALYSNTTGDNNTAVGRYALFSNTLQNNNTALGFAAGDGYLSTNSTFLGMDTNPNASGYTNCMGLGYNARPTGSNVIHVGDASITTIAGQVGFTTYSDRRFKQNVRENVEGLPFILRLRPVSYTLDVNGIAAYLKEDQGRDESGNIVTTPPDEATRRSREAKSKIQYTGFIAQEVEAAAAATGYDFSGVDKPQNESGLYGLRYAEFVVPLVKAVQEQQVEIGNLKLENAAQASEIERLKNVETQLASLSRELGKISAALAGAGIAVEK